MTAKSFMASIVRRHFRVEVFAGFLQRFVAESRLTCEQRMDANNDAELVRMARAGNRDAYGALIRRYQHQIWGLACVLLDDRFEAEDATQEAFLRAWLNLDVLSDPAKFAPWLRRIVFGVSIDWLRVFRPDLYRLSDIQTELELSGQPAHTESALRRLEAIELQQRIWEAVARLPPRYRLPLTLFHLDGLSHSKVAEALGVPVSTVRSLVTRARQKLQPMLASYAAEVLPALELEDVFKETLKRRAPDEHTMSSAGYDRIDMFDIRLL